MGACYIYFDSSLSLPFYLPYVHARIFICSISYQGIFNKCKICSTYKVINFATVQSSTIYQCLGFFFTEYIHCRIIQTYGTNYNTSFCNRGWENQHPFACACRSYLDNSRIQQASGTWLYPPLAAR